jgi:hypothetical protein
MRLAIPLLPWTILVGIERRSRQPIRWRFRLRTVLIIVAIAALFMGAWMANCRHQAWKLLEKEWKRREQEYQAKAATYARSEISHLLAAGTGKSSPGYIGDPTGYRELRVGPNEHSRLAAEAGRLKRMFEKSRRNTMASCRLLARRARSQKDRRRTGCTADSRASFLVPQPLCLSRTI